MDHPARHHHSLYDQALAACTFDGHYARRVMRLAPLSIFYPLYYWIVVFPCFVLGFVRGLWPGGSARWQRTARVTEQ